MQAVMRNRGLVVTILVIAMLAAVFLIVCSDGLHVPSPASTVGACLTMLHSPVVGAVIGSGLDRSLAPAVFAAMAGLAMFVIAVRTTSPLRPRSMGPGKPIDPLNGRLRL